MRLVWIFAAIGILSVAPAQAAPIVIQQDHVAYGIHDVLINDVLYDVTFRFGSYSEVFTLPPTFLAPYSIGVANGNGGASLRASSAVGTALNMAQVSDVSDGIISSRVFNVPWTIDPDGVIFNSKNREEEPSAPYIWLSDVAPAFATFDSPRMYAVFTESTTTPEPSTLLLSGLGLALAAARRRRALRA